MKKKIDVPDERQRNKLFYDEFQEEKRNGI